MKQTVGLLMGIYNEAARIAGCLEHHLPYVDEAAIVIQESDDGTEEVVATYLRENSWNLVVIEPESKTYVREGWAKIHVLHFPKMGCSEATLQDGVDKLETDWVLYVDADEKFPVDFMKTMYVVLEDKRYDGYRFERDNYFSVRCFNEAVPIEPKVMIIKHPMRDQQVRLTRRSVSVFPRQIHVRARVRDAHGIEHIFSLSETIYHLKDIEEQWTDNRQYLPDVRIVEAMEKTKHDELIQFPAVDSGINGSLVFAEIVKQIPFDIKRVFWIKAGGEASRGDHANLKVHEVLVCLQGSVKVLLDNGQRYNEFVLNDPSKGLFIKSKTWIKMTEFAENTILMCLASEPYDEKDYLRDYKAFEETIK